MHDVIARAFKRWCESHLGEGREPTSKDARAFFVALRGAGETIKESDWGSAWGKPDRRMPDGKE